MPVTISAADTCAVLDLVASAWLRGIGTSGSNQGIGLPASGWGAGGPLASLRSTLTSMASTYLEPVAALINPVLTLANGLDGGSIMAAQLQPIYSALQAHVAASGLPSVQNIDTFLTYYNVGAGGTWQALMPGQAWALFQKWLGNANGLSPWNHYFEVLTGSDYPNGLFKGTVTGPGAVNPATGFSIDSGHYAGGFPLLNVSSLTGSGAVTVTGSAFDPVAKAISDGVTWACTLAPGATSGTLVPGGPTPAPANSLILAASAIGVVSGISHGTITVEAHRPAGRPLLPE